jgi:hypothetical protein
MKNIQKFLVSQGKTFIQMTLTSIPGQIAMPVLMPISTEDDTLGM